MFYVQEWYSTNSNDNSYYLVDNNNYFGNNKNNYAWYDQAWFEIDGYIVVRLGTKIYSWIHITINQDFSFILEEICIQTCN